MIAEFEEALANVLGARLPDPFDGTVFVASAPGNAFAYLLGVEQVDLRDPDLGSRRAENVPGLANNRRVVRATCTIAITVRPGQNQGRGQQVAALDAALFVLDAPDFRDGSALRTAEDSGFFIHHMRCIGTHAPLNPQSPNAERLALTLEADGWFWPVGQPAEAGIAIGEIRLRGVSLPILVAPSVARISAGGPPVDIIVRIGRAGALRITEDGVAALPFANIAVAAFAPGNRPPNGTVTGGADGAEGVRVFDAAAGEVTVRYTPPAQPARDTLVIALEDGEGGLGVELGRFPLVVRGG